MRRYVWLFGIILFIIGFLFGWEFKQPKTIIEIETKTDTLIVSANKAKGIDFSIGEVVYRFDGNETWTRDIIQLIYIDRQGLWYGFVCESWSTGDMKTIYVPAKRVIKESNINEAKCKIYTNRIRRLKQIRNEVCGGEK